MHAQASNPKEVSVAIDGSYFSDKKKSMISFRFVGGNINVGGVEDDILIKLRHSIKRHLELRGD